jgi:hypothetical protein
MLVLADLSLPRENVVKVNTLAMCELLKHGHLGAVLAAVACQLGHEAFGWRAHNGSIRKAYPIGI